MTELKPAAAAAQAGVTTTALRGLIAAGAIPATPLPRGQVTINPADVPTRERCIALAADLLRRDAEAALAAVRNVEQELEAVRLDIIEALDHPDEPLGNDVRTFPSRSDSAYHERFLAAADATITLVLTHRLYKDTTAP